MTENVERPIPEIDESISKTFDMIETNIINEKYKTMEYDFFKTFFEITAKFNSQLAAPAIGLNDIKVTLF